MKNLMKIGKQLSKAEQKQINGGLMCNPGDCDPFSAIWIPNHDGTRCAYPSSTAATCCGDVIDNVCYTQQVIGSCGGCP